MSRYLIVGGSQGIGKSVVEKLVADKHELYVWGRRELDMPGVKYICNDVMGDLDLTGLPQELDGVVYCPGSLNLKPFHRITAADFAQDWHINVLGAIKTLQATLPLLKKSNHASVVLFSTVAVSLGMPFHASIASCKGAIEGLVKSLAAEWAPNIRVNAIAPSLTNTPLTEKIISTAEKMEAACKRHPLQKIGEASDISNLVQFLLSPQSSWMTGQVLHLDGGKSAIST